VSADKTILLVEDNEDDVFIVRRAFQKAGINNPLFVAEDGRIALDYIAGSGEFGDRKRFPVPALMLLDLKLPRVMGLDVLKSIRNNPALSAMLVVILTSSDQQPDIDRAYRLGANSYIVKPPMPDKMESLARCMSEYWFGWNTLPPHG
jgi:CheY-like chemotaxis protein